MPFVLGHGAEEGDKATAQRCGEIEMGLVQNHDRGPAGVDAFDQEDAIEHERVARSHSATTRQSPLPSSSMALTIPCPTEASVAERHSPADPRSRSPRSNRPANIAGGS